MPRLLKAGAFWVEFDRPRQVLDCLEVLPLKIAGEPARPLRLAIGWIESDGFVQVVDCEFLLFQAVVG
jgi:hypothetical protein